jgi:hypothetical protein
MAVQPRSARHGCVRRKSLIASIAVVIPCLLLYALSFESQLMSDKQRSGRVVRPEESSPEVATTVSYILEVLKWNITRDESDTATLPSFAAGTCFRADEANSMQRCLPSFIIIGTQKSGTTELASWLQANPGLLRVRQHESHFFDCLREFIIRPKRGVCPLPQSIIRVSSHSLPAYAPAIASLFPRWFDKPLVARACTLTYLLAFSPFETLPTPAYSIHASIVKVERSWTLRHQTLRFDEALQGDDDVHSYESEATHRGSQNGL